MNNAHEIAVQVSMIKKLAEKMSASGHSFSPDFHVILLVKKKINVSR